MDNTEHGDQEEMNHAFFIFLKSTNYYIGFGGGGVDLVRSYDERKTLAKHQDLKTRPASLCKLLLITSQLPIYDLNIPCCGFGYTNHIICRQRYHVA